MTIGAKLNFYAEGFTLAGDELDPHGSIGVTSAIRATAEEAVAELRREFGDELDERTVKVRETPLPYWEPVCDCCANGHRPTASITCPVCGE